MKHSIKMILLAASFIFAAATAFAAPTGTFDVVGTNPDGNGEYRGTVTVTRTGETYSVVWDVQGTRFVGTGLGAIIRDGQITVGPAQKADTGISVAYVSDSSFGIALYFEQDDGTWKGVWTYGGSERVASENWYRR